MIQKTRSEQVFVKCQNEEVAEVIKKYIDKGFYIGNLDHNQENFFAENKLAYQIHQYEITFYKYYFAEDEE